MEARIYKPKQMAERQARDRPVISARVKLAGDGKVRDIALQVSDKQVAHQKLNKLIQELEHESAGLIPRRWNGRRRKVHCLSGFGICQGTDRPGAVGRHCAM